MSEYKRCSVVFNLGNPLHKSLYDWCNEQSTNFSDFARTVLFMYMNSQTLNSVNSSLKSDSSFCSLSNKEATLRGLGEKVVNNKDSAVYGNQISSVSTVSQSSVKDSAKSDADAMLDML